MFMHHTAEVSNMPGLYGSTITMSARSTSAKFVRNVDSKFVPQTLCNEMSVNPE